MHGGRSSKRSTLRQRLLKSAEDLGPGVITGAADDDPSGIATYSQAGAQFGYGLLWTMVLTYPLMSAVQLISAHIGRVTGAGLAKNMQRSFPRWTVTLLVGILLAANTFNIGADLAAMAAATELVIGGGSHVLVIAFALICVGSQLFVPYRTYVRILKWLTLTLFSYVAVVLLAHVDWSDAVAGLVWPRDLGRAAILTTVAVFGTTISPYLFFWQSSQEAEEVAVSPGRKPLRDNGRGASAQFRRMRFDTFVGMAFSNLIALAIMLATAATLNSKGVTDVQTAAQAAEALRPVAGQFAFALFAMGIIGTGLLAVPVLAGSAAFAVSEARGWKSGLEYRPDQAVGFYAVITAAIVVGVLLDWSDLDPIKALFWSAVLNGVAAVPIMTAMMLIASRRSVMGRFVEKRVTLFLGWAATLVMGLASIAMLANLTLPLGR